ncbi:MAG: hypothetical protein EPO13_05480 [Actinomycetota bacterium]|nr:MAG: hypothetical protein EPO13_05480 [Actinomycetota bacterium]
MTRVGRLSATPAHATAVRRWRAVTAAGGACATVLAVGALAVLGGCGVPVEGTARPLPVEAVSGYVSGSPNPTDPVRDALARLWFLSQGMLVETRRAVNGPQDVGDLLGLLDAGPTQTEQAAGLRTATVGPLSNTPLVSAPSSTPSAEPSATLGTPTLPAASQPAVATVPIVVLQDGFGELPATEQVRVLGQVVLTLTDAGAVAVSFVDPRGQSLAVPSPEGRLVDRAATAADYESLVGRSTR